MRKKQSNISYLYLSPIDFKDLAIVFDKFVFEIKLLIAYRKNGNSVPVVFTSANISKEFSLLNENSTLIEIQNILIEQNLGLSEFELVSGFKLKSVVENDVLLEFPSNDSSDSIIHKVMAVWQLPDVKYYPHYLELIKPNALFEFNPKIGTPALKTDVRLRAELIDYLWQDWNDELIATGDYKPHYRICFISQLIAKPISLNT